VVKKQGGVVRIEEGGVNKCKSVVKTFKTVVKIKCIIEVTWISPGQSLSPAVTKAREAGPADSAGMGTDGL
jgi:hypothetical protein